MNALLLISASIFGQCSGGSCPAPSAGLSYAPTFAPPMRVLPPVAPPRPTGLPQAPRPAGSPADAWAWVYEPTIDPANELRVHGQVQPNGDVLWFREYQESPMRRRPRVAVVKIEEPPTVKLEAPTAKDEHTPSSTPISRPTTKHTDERRAYTHGVDSEQFTMGGRVVAKGEDARRFVAEVQAGDTTIGDDERFPDDSDKLRVTVIGTTEEREPVMQAFKTGALSKLKDKILLQKYTKSNWAVETGGMHVYEGRPTILVQEPNGHVDYRWNDFSKGDQAVADVIARFAVRKPDPSHQSKDDPTPDSTQAASTPFYFALAVVIAIAVAIAFARPRR